MDKFWFITIIPTLLSLVFFQQNIYFLYASYLFYLTFLMVLAVKYKFFAVLSTDKLSLLKYFFIFILVLGFFRSYMFGVIPFSQVIFQCLFVFSITIFSMSVMRVYNENKVLSVFTAIPLYVSVNVILYLLGLRNSSNAYYAVGNAKLISSLTGMDIQRAYFPLSQGINAFGVVAGLGFVLSFFLYINKKNHSNILILLLNTLGLLLSDSRGAFIALIITLLLIFSRFKYLNLCVLFSPLYSLFVLSIYITIQIALPGLIRSTTSILSGRELIWESAISGLGKFSILDFSVGFGYLGQAASKVYLDYSYLFSDRSSTSEVYGSFHSSFIQLFYDMGFFGLISVVAILYIIITNAKKYTNHPNLYIAFVLYSIFAGTFDMTINIYNQYIFVIFIMICATFISEVKYVKKSS